MHELILGGQKSGKSRTAETRAAHWLTAAPGRQAVLLATAQPGDDEMRLRIARHREDRALRVPALRTLEVSDAMTDTVLKESDDPRQLVIVDCLTLWLTQRMLPLEGEGAGDAELDGDLGALLQALQAARGPVACCRPTR